MSAVAGKALFGNPRQKTFKTVAQDFKIKTELSVHEMAEVLKSNSKIKELREIDSINYGEGYDFILNNISCRLYIDVDSDCGLIIEFDRHNKLASAKQKEIEELLIQLTSDT